MNELPKSVRDELARQQATGLVHPDADLLTAFAEGTATPAERARVEQHLALCGQCREVMFLATPAQEAASPAVELKPQRRTRWFPVWVPWALAATILFAVTWTVTTRKTEMALNSRVNQNKVDTYIAQQQSPEAPKSQAVVPAPQAAKPAATPTRASNGHLASFDATTAESKAKEADQTTRRDKYEYEAKKDTAANGAMGGMTASGVAAQTSPRAQNETAEVVAPPPAPAAPGDRVATASRNTSLKPGPAAPVQNQMAQNQNVQNQVAVAQDSATAGMAKTSVAETTEVQSMKTLARAKAHPNVHWRISPAGGLERQVSNSDWTPIALAAGTHFTVVASIGNAVWAGNDVGALYRSDDGGANWTLVALPGIANGPGSRINAIEFRDSLSGSVATADGNRWSTSNGGRSWQHN